MFGENPMYGVVSVKTDNKGRMVVPNFTGVETGEELVLVRMDGFIKVVTKKYLDTIISETLEVISQTYDLEQRKLLVNYLHQTCEGIIKNSKVDAQKRINVGHEFVGCEYIKVVEVRDYIFLKGEKGLK